MFGSRRDAVRARRSSGARMGILQTKGSFHAADARSPTVEHGKG